MKTVLIIDDEQSVRLSLEAVFSSEYRVRTAANGQEALEETERHSPDLAILDLMMPGMSGLDLLPQLKDLDPRLPVVVLSALHEVPQVVNAMQLGAAHYLTKPFNVDELRIVARLALQQREKDAEIDSLSAELSRWYDVNKVVGESAAWTRTLNTLRRAAAAADTTVLLYGESGTGKELLARLTHTQSARKDAPLIPIHCAAIPEPLMESELFGHEKGSFTGAERRRHGCVEMADGGSLFLDEVGEMPLPMQRKLLRFLQDRSFMRLGGRTVQQADVRIIAATNRSLRDGVKEGWFREDLFYRLNVIPIDVPPLREREGDVERLASHFLNHFRHECRSRVRTIAADAMDLMKQYHWPGNVRELRNLIERTTVLHGRCEAITANHLPPEFHAGSAGSGGANDQHRIRLPLSLKDEVAQLESLLIQRALHESGQNLSRAAELLDCSRRILKYKIDQYAISWARQRDE